MEEIRQRVSAVRRRQQRQWMWQCASAGLVASGLAAFLPAIARLMMWPHISWRHVVGILVAGPALGAVYSMRRSRPDRDAAAAIDRTYQLKDRAATALEFLQRSPGLTDWQKLQLEDAAQHLAVVKPVDVAPVRAPRSWVWALSLFAVVMVILVSGTRTEQVSAEIVTNTVVAAQADRVEVSLEELRDFAGEDIDPEIMPLLRELAARLVELRQPGVNSREALAKLSEMEQALLEQQQRLDNPDTQARLAEIGSALKLSDEMRAAGEAMVQGKLNQAAEELAKLGFPTLNRQTRKALTEKLNAIEQNDDAGSHARLKQAAAQAADGLNKGDRSQFRDAMNGLAEECRAQGRRRELSDLLKKQCRILGESKAECAAASRQPGNSTGQGGRDWGTGTADHQAGDQTSRLDADHRMDITGVESAAGETDVETVSAPETAQEAVRRYRSQSDRYDQLRESVLESERIPLGHRQTIRRYFDSIHPTADDVEAVSGQIKSSP